MDPDKGLEWKQEKNYKKREKRSWKYEKRGLAIVENRTGVQVLT